jgi:hypothetical protein
MKANEKGNFHKITKKQSVKHLSLSLRCQDWNNKKVFINVSAWESRESE